MLVGLFALYIYKMRDALSSFAHVIPGPRLMANGSSLHVLLQYPSNSDCLNSGDRCARVYGAKGAKGR